MATDVEVIMDIPAVDKFRGWNGPIGKSFERLAKESVARQKAMANRRSGALAASIHWKKAPYVRGMSFHAGSPLNYALFVEEGTKPHQILPKKPGGMLVFYWAKAGGTVYLRSVNHPGTRPYKFLMHGVERAMGVWNRAG